MASSNKKRTTPAQTKARAQAAVAGGAVAGDVVRAGMDVYDKIVWFCLHALLIFVPIAISNLTWLGIGNGLPLTYDQFDIAKIFTMRAITLVALGAWGWKTFMKGGQIRRTKADWFIVAFLGWVLLTTFTSISPATAIFGKYRRFEGFLSFLNYAIIYFLVVQMVDRPSRIRSLMRSLFIGGVLVAFYGLLQFAGADPIKWGTLPFEAQRSFSTYGNPDLLGGYLMFPLPIALGLALTEESAMWRAAYWGGFFALALVWITAFVRGAWIGGAVSLLIIAVAVIVLVRRKELALHGTVDGGAAAITGAAVIALVIQSSRSANSVMNVIARLKSIFEFGQGSALTRFEIWEAAWAAIKARPITGWGADTFRLVFPLFKPIAYTKDAGYLSVADNVHDYPLQLASGIGIPGLLLLYAGVFGVVLYLSARAILERATGPVRMLLIAVWAACVAYIVHLFFGLSVTGSTFMLWFCFGILMSPLAVTRDVKAPAWGMIAAIASVGVLAVAFVLNVVYVRADNYYLQARINQYDAASHVTNAKAAVSLNPWNDMYRAEVGLAYQDEMYGWLQQALQTTDATQRQTALGQAKTAFQNAEASLLDTIAFVPSEYDNYVFLSDLYNRAGTYFDRSYYQKALDAATKAIKDVEPYGPAVRFQAAMAYQGLGQNPQALAMLETCIKMDPNYVDPYLLKADILRSQGKLAEAKTTLEAALKVAVAGTPAATQAQNQLASIEASMKAAPKK